MKLILELIFIFCCGGMVIGYFTEWRKEKANKKCRQLRQHIKKEQVVN